MKIVIVLAALIAIAVAAPAPNEHAEILKLDSNVEHDGYSFDVETSDGTSRHEDGKVKDFDSEHPAIVVHGTFTWKDEHDGKVYTVNYVADENGFQPTGEHLPKLPAIAHA
ncbi:larval cuticle protein 65Ab1-like [Musca vetustissima]|uniref:larval cuticle protein 65Ab1-like n=1 Tax=Musca vetustissima TaxID=27455 RepID=UPI002AB6FDD8|nr:larval cuticle protein 65Ab1-like [Musca vetustissima]